MHPLAVVGADRDVLQVGIRGGKAAGRCDRLVEGGVDPVRLQVDQGGQRVDVGPLELAQLPVFQDLAYHDRAVVGFGG